MIAGPYIILPKGMSLAEVRQDFQWAGNDSIEARTCDYCQSITKAYSNCVNCGAPHRHGQKVKTTWCSACY